MWNSYSSSQFGGLPDVAGIQNLGLGYSPEEIERLRAQDVGEGEVNIRLFHSTWHGDFVCYLIENVHWFYLLVIVKCRLYEGRVVQGPLKGTEALFKVLLGLYDGATFLRSRCMNLLTILCVLRHRFWNKGISWVPFWCFWSWLDGS